MDTSFEARQQAQIEAIEASGMDPMEWVEQHAAAWAAEWEGQQ